MTKAELMIGLLAQGWQLIDDTWTEEDLQELHDEVSEADRRAIDSADR